MANTTLTNVVNYLNQQKNWGKTEVYRSSIFDVIEYSSGTMLNPKDLPTGLLVEAAKIVNGCYKPYKNGKSKIVFN